MKFRLKMSHHIFRINIFWKYKYITVFIKNCGGLRIKLKNNNCKIILLLQKYFSKIIFIILNLNFLIIISIDVIDMLLNNCIIVFFAIYNSFPFCQLNLPLNNVEKLFVRFSIGFNNFIIGSVYFSSGSLISFYESYKSTVKSVLLLYLNHLSLFYFFNLIPYGFFFSFNRIT